MATAKKKDRLDGTDRWTSKGYGIQAKPLTAAQKADVEKLNRELDAQKKKKSTKKR
jgi:hypothetical protein